MSQSEDIFAAQQENEILEKYDTPKIDHKFYIDWGVEHIEKAIAKLESSQEESGNALVRAVINNLKQQKSLLTSGHQLY